MVKWLFFDLGSTLINETACEPVRIQNTVQDSSVSFEEFDRMYRALAARNQDGYSLAREHFHLSKGAWPTHLERLYPDVPMLLQKWGQHYALGVIANQKAGLGERLHALGIKKYFQVIVGSADLGAAKPDLRIFRHALEEANCAPREAVMIGDRLDNDVVPAQALGMRTVWLRQGYGALGNTALLEKQPDHVADSLADLDMIFGGAL